MNINKIIYIFFSFLIISCSSNNKKAEKYKEDLIAQTDTIFKEISQERINKKSKYLDKIFSRLYKKRLFNGTVLYAEQGQIIYKKAFGYSNFRKKEKLTTASSFQLASVSKLFTAISIMQLKEKGIIDYDKDIRNYIKDFPYEGITVRLLLNHRSGLPRYMSLGDKYWNKKLPMSNQDMLDMFIKYHPKPYFKPDRMYNYINTNYALLALIVEKTTKIPFDEYVKENIFEPLHMNNSIVYSKVKDPEIPNKVTGYIATKRRGYVIADNDWMNGIIGDKGVYSSVEDMFKLDRALFTDKLLKQSTLKEAIIPGGHHKKIRDNKMYYGFGMRIKSRGENKYVYHFGWWKGFRSYYIKNITNKRTIIVLCNRQKYFSSRILWKIINNKL